MSTKPVISKFNQLAEMMVHKYERYLPTAFDESMSLVEKVNKVIQYLNEIGVLVNGVVEQWNEVMEWVMNDGLNEAVRNRLDEMVEDGTLADIINEQIFGELNADLRARAVNVIREGAIGDGITDDTFIVQQTIDNNVGKTILFPKGYTVVLETIYVPLNTSIQIEGTVLKKPASTGAMFSVRNVDNVKMFGNGTIDGNKYTQSVVSDQVGLIDVEYSHHFSFEVKNIKGNYFPREIAGAQTTGCVFIKYSNFVNVNGVYISDYAREGIWLKTCNDSSISNVVAVGGSDSWSGIQFSGTRNSVSNVKVKNAGASGISLDSTYSVMSDCIVTDNGYWHGFNFGHAGIPSDFTIVNNCISINAGILETNTAANSTNAFNVAAGSIEVTFNNCKAIGARKHGFNVSDSSNNVQINGCKAVNCSAYGLNIYDAKVVVSNTDLRGNINGPFFRGGTTSREEFTNVRLSDDQMYASAAINGLGAGGTVTITNGNIRQFSKVFIEPSNLAGKNAMPFISSLNDTNIVVTTVNSGAGGASIRYWIV